MGKLTDVPDEAHGHTEAIYQSCPLGHLPVGPCAGGPMLGKVRGIGGGALGTIQFLCSTSAILMVRSAYMKTTIKLPVTLLECSKSLACRKHATLKALTKEGLRRRLLRHDIVDQS